jgi:Arc/MetJ-type ribon-helix-helix transcriptional regulator
VALTLTLDQHGEQIVTAQLNTGRYRSPEDVVASALEALSVKESVTPRKTKTLAEAVAHICEFA